MRSPVGARCRKAVPEAPEWVLLGLADAVAVAEMDRVGTIREVRSDFGRSEIQEGDWKIELTYRAELTLM